MPIKGNFLMALPKRGLSDYSKFVRNLEITNDILTVNILYPGQRIRLTATLIPYLWSVPDVSLSLSLNKPLI